MSDTIHEEAHTGPIKNPKQLLAAVFASFVIPILVIIALVTFVTSADKPAAGAGDLAKAADMRIQRIGTVEIRDANRPLKAGEEVFKAQCTTCHSAGVAGAPKFGDAAAWGPRIVKGYEALLQSALHGKGAMAPQGGGDFDDVEVGRAVVYMANAGGAKLAEPQRVAVPATADAAPADAANATAAGGATATAAAAEAVPVGANAQVAAAAAPPATQQIAAAAAPATAVPATAGNANGEALYKQVCFACHAAGVAGAPKFGDKAAWAPRIATGIDALTANAIKGKGAMPPKGGSSASDADIRSAVIYMVDAGK